MSYRPGARRDAAATLCCMLRAIRDKYGRTHATGPAAPPIAVRHGFVADLGVAERLAWPVEERAAWPLLQFSQLVAVVK